MPIVEELSRYVLWINKKIPCSFIYNCIKKMEQGGLLRLDLAGLLWVSGNMENYIMGFFRGPVHRI